MQQSSWCSDDLFYTLYLPKAKEVDLDGSKSLNEIQPRQVVPNNIHQIFIHSKITKSQVYTFFLW